ncbi:MAG: carbon-nitrogen hydrolase family protein [Alphaproteobacteria bacterium]|nr:carbon-nitrogen hydrolase family protein [Alphaproteobacteria bacterium]
MSDFCVSIFQQTARDDPPAAKLNWLDMAANRASGQGANLLICPALSLSGHHVGDMLRERAEPVLGEYSERVGEIASLHEIAIVFGYPEVADGALFNACAFIQPNGKMLSHHRKNHVPPGFEAEYFSPDSHVRVFDYAGWRMALLIGYDIEFPEAARQAALQGAEFLIVPTALSSKWKFIAETLVPARAFENGVFLAYANWAGRKDGADYLGGSRIVGPDGVCDAEAGASETILMATLEKSRLENTRARQPYLQDRQRYHL